ncbi:MAG: glycosyltransferase family 2 protein [Bacteroidota bacterium]|nr:glycosyltransferase family 2 protein [Bacteroidota bacterium]
MRPVQLPDFISAHYQPNEVIQRNISQIRQKIAALERGMPEVSVVMPAYNEEDSILKTLSCLAATTTPRSVEIIVVNNNSRDNTESIVESTGARCIRETKQGITPARNAGLAAARGKYILNADADTIYPPDWIEQMVKPLDDNAVSCVYGRFSFIPTAGTPRWVYFFYEYMADMVRLVNKKFKEEAVNVYGFNSGFRREQGIAVDGFDHPPATNEDGWLAVKLRDKGFGKLYYVTHPAALVWTTDRRIQTDGGLWQGFAKRVKRVLANKGNEYRY